MIAVLGTLDPVSVRLLAQAHPRGSSIPAFAMLLDVATWRQPDAVASTDCAASALALRSAGWRVVVASSGDTTAGAWRALMRSAAREYRASRGDGAMITRPPGAIAGLDLADTRRTLWAYVACCLGILPLCALFTNRIWVGDVWIAMLVVVGPAALLRLRWAPRVWQTWVGLGALVLWLTARYLSRYAVCGVLPGRGSWHDLQRYLDDLHQTTTTTAAPIHSTLGRDAGALRGDRADGGAGRSARRRRPPRRAGRRAVPRRVHRGRRGDPPTGALGAGSSRPPSDS